MVNHSSIRTGIDIVGDDCLAARVGINNSAPKILFVSRFTRIEMANVLKSESGAILLAVPDESVILKNIPIPQNSTGNREELAKFELKQMLVDKSEEFCCDIIETDSSDRLLAIIARKAKLEQIWKYVYTVEENGIHAEGFLVRSLALGRGFLKFCTNNTERLVCLADFARDRVSLCLVLGENIMEPASFDRSQYDPETESGLARIAAELKTIINFKLSEMADRGVNASVAKLIICGGKLTELKKLVVASRLMIPIEEPIFNRTLIDGSIIESNLLLSDFLVSLGLTVE